MSLARIWFSALFALRKSFSRPTAFPRSIQLSGQDLPLPFLTGFNLPWIGYGSDFGRSPWSPQGGVGGGEKKIAMERILARLAGEKGRVLRWFLFCDGRGGIEYAADGTPLGPDPLLWRDLEAALECAASNNLQLVLTLFDFLWLLGPVRAGEVTLRQGAAVVGEKRRRQALLDNLLAPLCDRFRESKQILAWEIINEPEWAVRGFFGGPSRGGVSFLAMRRFLAACVRTIRQSGSRPVTVGLAGAGGMSLVRGLELDFYQLHWYPSRQKKSLRIPELSSLAPERPVLLGEYPLKNSPVPPALIPDIAGQQGYCGALGWSLNAPDRYSGSVL